MGRPRLLLAPLNEDLLCAFSPCGITSLPKPKSRQPDQKKRRASSNIRVRSRPGSRPKAVNILTPEQWSSLKAVRSAPTPQQAKPHLRAQLRAPCYTGDPRIRSPQTGKAISSAPVRVLLLSHLRFRQQADSQGTLQRPVAQHSQQVAPMNMLSPGGGIDGSWKNLVATSGVANPSDGPGPTLSVEGNGGPWPGHENKVTNVGAANAVGDASTTHILSANLEAKKNFDMGEYLNWM